MKKIIAIVTLALTLVFCSTSPTLANDTHFFLGANAGLDIGLGGSDSTSVDSSGLSTGLTLRWIGDAMGLGYSMIKSTHDDNESVPGIAKSKLSFNSLDILFRYDKENNDTVKYIFVSVGSIEENFNGTISGIQVHDINEGDILGIGIGGFSKPSEGQKFTLGGEIRYVRLDGSENMKGNIQAMFIFGFDL